MLRTTHREIIACTRRPYKTREAHNLALKVKYRDICEFYICLVGRAELLLFVLSICFSIPSRQLFILAFGCESSIFSERKKRRGACFDRGLISALFIIISMFDFESVWTFPNWPPQNRAAVISSLCTDVRVGQLSSYVRTIFIYFVRGLRHTIIFSKGHGNERNGTRLLVIIRSVPF